MLGVSGKRVFLWSAVYSYSSLKLLCGFLQEYTRSRLNEGFVVQPVVICAECWEPLHKQGSMAAVEGDRRAGPWGKRSPG